MSEESRYQLVGKKSHRNALLSSISVLIILVSLFYSAWKLKALDEAIMKKKGEIGELESRRIMLFAQNDSLTQIVYHLDSVLAMPISEKKSVSLSNVLKPRTEAKLVEGLRGYQDLQVYDFSLWLDVPQQWKAKIAEVRYEFNHPSFHQKAQVSSDPTTGFRVGYRGWGCLHIVTISAAMIDGSTNTIEFDMCKALGVGD